jgi:hypothetical protein
MKDAFHNRTHTRGLLDLILSLDEASPKEIMTVAQPSVIVSGTPDFLTGVYYSNALSRSLPNNRHVNFTMGSHFILLEWPDILATELLDFVLHYPEQHRRGAVDGDQRSQAFLIGILCHSPKNTIFTIHKHQINDLFLNRFERIQLLIFNLIKIIEVKGKRILRWFAMTHGYSDHWSMHGKHK